jgi:hypothetical protein
MDRWKYEIRLPVSDFRYDALVSMLSCEHAVSSSKSACRPSVSCNWPALVSVTLSAGEHGLLRCTQDEATSPPAVPVRRLHLGELGYWPGRCPRRRSVAVAVTASCHRRPLGAPPSRVQVLRDSSPTRRPALVLEAAPRICPIHGRRDKTGVQPSHCDRTRSSLI